MASGWATPSPCPGGNCQTSFVAEEWNGSAWTVSDDAASSAISPVPYSSISCPTATFCMEAGFNHSAMTWNGTSWQSVPGYPLLLDSLSCASAAMCLTVVDVEPTAEVWNGKSWTATNSLRAGDELVSVSCSGGGTCIAAGGHYYVRAVAYSWNGRSLTPLAPANP